jgi:hypothetical protein
LSNIFHRVLRSDASAARHRGERLAPLDRCHIFDRTQAVIYAVREGVIDVGDLEYRPPREPLP